MYGNYDLIVFSHLNWDFVYQRPQHLLSRMAASHRVFFIQEQACVAGEDPHWDFDTPAPNVLVCKPCTNLASPGFSDEQLSVLKVLLKQLVREQKLENYVLWLYTPMALPLAQELEPEAVVYDCMDELSAFRFAPPQLLEREATLLRWADVVFTGGPSLYKAKKGRHDNLYCFPSSVDAAHFMQAASVHEAADQAHLPHPRLGFYGVIDERMDLALLDALAKAHPEWQIVMLGPVVKIDVNDLPERPNIHYIGQRSYEELPSYLAGWDVCLLPFARNESTRFISPTKTLEYMVAEKPIVSTPITDVAVPYGDIVYLGATPEEFIAACEQALSSSDEEKATRSEKMRSVLARTSWSATVLEMEELIVEALQHRDALPGGAQKAVALDPA